MKEGKLVLAFGLVLAVLGSTVAAQEKKKEPTAGEKRNNAVTKQANKEEEKGGQQEGIRVHGHWTIEVRGKDGAFVSRTQFENSLTPNGAGFLVQLMGRQASVGLWTLQLANENPDSFDPNLSLIEILIFEPTAGMPSAQYDHLSYNNNLTLSVGQTLTLSGSGIVPSAAASSAAIGYVNTIMQTCPPTYASAVPCPMHDAPSLTTPSITRATLNAPVPVQAGQQVLVTVIITFS